MNCDQVLERLWPFLDHELDEAAAAELQQHLDACRRCFSRAEFERQLRGMLRRCCERDRAPAELQQRLRELVRLF